MNERRKDRIVEGLVRRALVARGYRPRSDEELEQALDAIGEVEISAEKHDRLLAKIRGEQPYDMEVPTGDAVWTEGEAEELVEMFRERCEEIPPEIVKRLEELERQAGMDPPAEKEDGDDGET